MIAGSLENLVIFNKVEELTFGSFQQSASLTIGATNSGSDGYGVLVLSFGSGVMPEQCNIYE